MEDLIKRIKALPEWIRPSAVALGKITGTSAGKWNNLDSKKHSLNHHALSRLDSFIKMLEEVHKEFGD